MKSGTKVLRNDGRLSSPPDMVPTTSPNDAMGNGQFFTAGSVRLGASLYMGTSSGYTEPSIICASESTGVYVLGEHISVRIKSLFSDSRKLDSTPGARVTSRFAEQETGPSGILLIERSREDHDPHGILARVPAKNLDGISSPTNRIGAHARDRSGLTPR